MTYIKYDPITENYTVVSEKAIRDAHPDTSFPQVLKAFFAAGEFIYSRVIVEPKPETDQKAVPGHIYQGDDGFFYQPWVISPLSAEEKKELSARAVAKARRIRSSNYPPIGDQLDVIWRQLNHWRLNGDTLIQEADDMLAAILAVKKKFPKPPTS